MSERSSGEVELGSSIALFRGKSCARVGTDHGHAHGLQLLEGDVAHALKDVRAIEVRRFDTGRTLGLGLLMLAGLVTLGVFIALDASAMSGS